jgi:hypothetical protein
VNQTDLLISGMLLGILLFWPCYKWWRAVKLKRRVIRARHGERKALDLLESEGYTIVELQKKAPVCATVDGKMVKTYIAADALVEKDGRCYVAEIKTGTEATRVTHAPTRRQLLEYFFIFRPHGILLVDMEQEKIKRVELDTAHMTESNICRRWVYVVIFVIGVLCGFYLQGGF